MLKITLLPVAALALAATLSGKAPIQALPQACDISSKAEAIAWSRSHPGESHLQACADQP